MKRFLYLNDNLLTIYHVEQKQLQELYCLQATDETDLAIFDNYLASDLQTPIVWLLDTALEEYQQITQPHVSGSERKTLLQRRLQRLFDHSAYTHAVFQGRESKGRGDDRFLLLAMNNAEDLLQPWLKYIKASRVPLQAICSVPLLTQSLLSYLPESKYTLIVSQAPATPHLTNENVRQSFFLKDQLQFSRLTPLTLQDQHKYAEYLLTQIMRTDRYLTTTRVLSTGQNLNVFILTNPPYFDLLAEYIAQNPSDTNSIQLIDLHELGGHLGLQFDGEQVNLQHLLIHLIAKKSPSNHYARTDEQRFYHYYQARLSLYFSSAILALGFLVGGAWLGYEAWQVQQKNALLDRRIKGIRAEMVKIDGNVEQLSEAELLSIKPVTQIGKILENQQYWPNLPLRRISQIFSNSQYRDFELKNITWQMDSPTLNSVETNALSASANTKAKTVSMETIRLTGEVQLQSQSESYLDTLRKFSALQDDLRKYGGLHWQVKIVNAPSRENIGGLAPFELEITVEHTYGEAT